MSSRSCVFAALVLAALLSAASGASATLPVVTMTKVSGFLCPESVGITGTFTTSPEQVVIIE